jgi:cytochrome c
MKIKIAVTLLLSHSLAFAAEDDALSGEEVARIANCMACHKVEARVVGPSYNDVARKYRAQISAAADQAAEEAQLKTYLYGKVKNGGVGVWGKIPMPANAHVKELDVHRIVDWIMSLPISPRP